jgi:hypothetical protein
MIELMPVTEMGLYFIACNLRAMDREEIFATRWDNDPSALVDECLFVLKRPSSFAVMAAFGGKIPLPIAVLGAVEQWPGVWDVWAFGTEDFFRVGFILTRYVRKTLIPTLLAKGARRAHCRSLASHKAAHQWLRALGATEDCERRLKSWGKNGEDFILFEWHRADMMALYKQEAA